MTEDPEFCVCGRPYEEVQVADWLFCCADPNNDCLWRKEEDGFVLQGEGTFLSRSEFIRRGKLRSFE